jgi:hypothetical protein
MVASGLGVLKPMQIGYLDWAIHNLTQHGKTHQVRIQV